MFSRQQLRLQQPFEDDLIDHVDASKKKKLHCTDNQDTSFLTSIEPNGTGSVLRSLESSSELRGIASKQSFGVPTGTKKATSCTSFEVKTRLVPSQDCSIYESRLQRLYEQLQRREPTKKERRGAPDEPLQASPTVAGDEGTVTSLRSTSQQVRCSPPPLQAKLGAARDRDGGPPLRQSTREKKINVPRSGAESTAISATSAHVNSSRRVLPAHLSSISPGTQHASLMSGRQVSQALQALPVPRTYPSLPTKLAATGIPGLLITAAHVWAALGFFEMRYSELSGKSSKTAAATSPPLSSPTGPQDTESFLLLIEELYGCYASNSQRPAAEVDKLTTLVRNGLWRVLFNAVFYCLTVLDGHRRRPTALSQAEVEVRTGGAEDAYDVVYGSEDGGAETEATTAQPPLSHVPVRLLWCFPGESDDDLVLRRVRDSLPPQSRIWIHGCSRGVEHARGAGRSPWGSTADISALRGSHAHSSLPSPDVQSHTSPTSVSDLLRRADAEVYGGRLNTPLPIKDWYWVLRCVAQMGYQRNTFYLQTPTQSNPHELLLILLWLTQRYKLITVAEYVELNRKYGFLLEYHADDAFFSGSSTPMSSARTRLLFSFSRSNAWPPLSFDESATIAARLEQVERSLGPIGGAEGCNDKKHSCPNTTATSACPTSAQQVRRLMAVRRLLTTAFNRLQFSLHQQAEQASLLGLHAPLDMQLSSQEHHSLYEELLKGLTHLQQTEIRVEWVAENISAAASMIAYLLRHDDAVVAEEEVLRSLEEDDTTWLEETAVESLKGSGKHGRTRIANSDSVTVPQSISERLKLAIRHGAMQPQTSPASCASRAESLAQALSNFHATHTKPFLIETWRSMLRQSQICPESLPQQHLQFLRDVEAQRLQEERVRENMKSRYSLQATLAAEWAVMRYEVQRRRSRSPSWSDERNYARQHRLISTVVPPLDLVTNASLSYLRLQEEEQAYGNVRIHSGDAQIVAVGQPSSGSTTSSKMGLDRLLEWERDELANDHGVAALHEAKLQRCRELLDELRSVYRLRIANPTKRALR